MTDEQDEAWAHERLEEIRKLLVDAPPVTIRWPTPPTRGPKPLVSLSDVLQARDELEDEGESSGERSIARRLGVSRDAVRYALGKDRPL